MTAYYIAVRPGSMVVASTVHSSGPQPIISSSKVVVWEKIALVNFLAATTGLTPTSCWTKPNNAIINSNKKSKPCYTQNKK